MPSHIIRIVVLTVTCGSACAVFPFDGSAVLFTAGLISLARISQCREQDLQNQREFPLPGRNTARFVSGFQRDARSHSPIASGVIRDFATWYFTAAVFAATVIAWSPLHSVLAITPILLFLTPPFTTMILLIDAAIWTGPARRS